MTSKKRCAALLAALILALGLIAVPRSSAAAGNDDLELLQPPGVQFGDPDSPDGVVRICAFGFRVWGQFEAGRLLCASPSRTVWSEGRGCHLWCPPPRHCGLQGEVNE
jgi:hypothetical protein